MNVPSHPYVVVRWRDAHAYQDQITTRDIDHMPLEMMTPGWCLRSDHEGVSVAAECVLSENDSYRGTTFIPRSLVIDESEVRLVKPRAKRKPKEVQSG